MVASRNATGIDIRTRGELNISLLLWRHHCLSLDYLKSRDIAFSDIVGMLNQRLALDIFRPGNISGDHESAEQVRALQVDQVNTKLLWLVRASSRAWTLETTTLSEPCCSFWLSFLLNRTVQGWARVLQGLTRFIHSMRSFTVNAGELGEVLAEVIMLLACD